MDTTDQQAQPVGVLATSGDALDASLESGAGGARDRDRLARLDLAQCDRRRVIRDLLQRLAAVWQDDRDGNLENLRGLDQWVRMGQADDMDKFKEALADIGGITVTLLHPDEMVTPANFKEYGVGTVGTDVHRDGDNGRSKREYLERAASFGVWKKHDRARIDRRAVTSVRRLGDL